MRLTLWPALTCLLANSVFAEDFAPLSQAEIGLGQYRSLIGAPAANYWQQQVDYQLNAVVRVNSQNRQVNLDAKATVTYKNNSPETLTQLFFLLDHNRLQPGAPSLKPVQQSAALGFQNLSVASAEKSLAINIEHTLLTVNLPAPLAPNQAVTLTMQWQLSLPDKVAKDTRSGVEWLADGSPILVAAQWFPRATAFTDYAGWSLLPFLGQGEFSTEFGNYQVSLDLPANFVVAASGIAEKQPTDGWQVTEKKARANRRLGVSKARKVWQFSGQTLRDFAFSASPAFLWQSKTDARGRKLQAFYPQEAQALWQPFALASMDYTLQHFDRATFVLPYQSVSIVNAAGIGMEYPGLATIATRPERPENTNTPAYEPLTKYDFIGSVIHEVGHNYIPMVVNTLEREWAWLDEGLVSFIEYSAEHGWEANFDVIYGEPRSIAAYTLSESHQAINTNADALIQKISGAYNKPASAFNQLRYLIIGPEKFDAGLAHFFSSWQYKRPLPGDFFRAMEQAAGQDLSWFWRSHFLEARSLDLGIVALQWQAPDKSERKQIFTSTPQPIAPALALNQQLNPKRSDFYTEQQPQLLDSYSNNQRPQQQVASTDVHPKGALTIAITNRGHAISPVPLSVQYSDGSVHYQVLPATVWQAANADAAGGTLLSFQPSLVPEKTPVSISLDPYFILPDTDRTNNRVELTP